MARSTPLLPHSSPLRFRVVKLSLVVAILAPLLSPPDRARAAKSTTGNWIGPLPMYRTWNYPNDRYTRATHLAVLRRQTAQGDSTLIVHWHDKSRIRAWRYDFAAQGGFVADTNKARILSEPAHNVFCSGHCVIHDGRLLIAGGTAPGTGGEIGTTEVSAFDPGQPDLWTATSNWVNQDTMKFNRWYPTLTHTGDGSVVASSGVEYIEMPVIGGRSPQDSTGSFRSLRSLGLSPYPQWPVEPVNLDPPATTHPQLSDHVSIATGQQRTSARDGRGEIITFGGIDGSGQPTNDTWQTWDVPVDPYNTWRTEAMPLTMGSPRPSARSQHAACIQEGAGTADSAVTMFVYGGRDAAGNALSDVWVLTKTGNLAAATWAPINPGLDTPDADPGARYGHTMVYDPGVAPGAIQGSPKAPQQYYPKLLVFGGKRNATTWADNAVYVLQLWAPYKWHRLTMSGSPPPARYRHAAVFDRSVRAGQTLMRMMLFGGAGSNGAPRSDSWTLSRALKDSLYDTWAWTEDAAGSAAPPVYKHSMIHDEQWNRLVVFGGDRSSEDATTETNTGGETNECYARSVDMLVTDHTWKKLATDSPILRRSGHSAVYYNWKGVNARIPERFNPLGTPGQRWSPPLTDSPKFDRATYPFMFAMPDGRLFYAGRGDTSEVLAAGLTGAWTDPKLAGVTISAIVGGGGTAVEYLPAKVIKVGSNGTQGVANLASFSGGSYQWSNASSFGLFSRGNANGTILPNGQVLITGGRAWHSAAHHDGSNSAPPVKTPQLWTPTTDVWTQGTSALAEEPVARGYHSTAILLPDARVLSAGGNPGEGGQVGDDDTLGTVFEPPYLFDPNISGGDGYATRPTIDIAPRWIGHGCPFTLSVTSASGVGGVCLIRPGAVTHAFNQDQIYVPLGFAESAGTVTVNGPADAYAAPPGDYLLFVLDNSSLKVPSVARWVRVAESIGPYQASDVVRPGRITTLNGGSGLYGPGCSRPITVTWHAPHDDSNTTTSGRARKFDLRYSTSAICDACWNDFAVADQVACEPPAGNPDEAQSVDVPGLFIGAYQFRMVSQDDQSPAGNWSAMSNAKTLYVFGCEEGLYAGGGEGGGSGLSARLVQVGDAAAAVATPLGSGENSVLPTSGGTSTDLLKLVRPRILDGQLRVMLRRGVSGETNLAAARLIAVDHPVATETFNVAGQWRLGERQPASAARGRRGEDLSSLLVGDPESSLVGDTGDTVEVTLPEAADPQAERTVYVEAQAGRVGDQDNPGLALLKRGSDGSWHEASRQMPRARFATLLAAGIAGDQVRLSFSGNHAVSALGQVALGAVAESYATSVISIAHSRLGAIEASALLPGGAGLVLQPMDTVQLAFELPATAAAGARDFYLEVTGSSTSGSAVAARAAPVGQASNLPSHVSLDAPFPNPFATATRVRLGLPTAASVRLEVFDLSGRRVATVARERMGPGWHELSWDGRATVGGLVAPGIYIVRLAAGSRSQERKVVVMR